RRVPAGLSGTSRARHVRSHIGFQCGRSLTKIAAVSTPTMAPPRLLADAGSHPSRLLWRPAQQRRHVSPPCRGTHLLVATSREAEHEPADLLAHEGREVQAVVRGPAGVCTAEGL